jgi:hypothetical protein
MLRTALDRLNEDPTPIVRQAVEQALQELRAQDDELE